MLSKSEEARTPWISGVLSHALTNNVKSADRKRRALKDLTYDYADNFDGNPAY